ncbi:MAG TPA: hypothetical protein PK650_12105 [Candidatus Sumerlaeota bacterium]|nr:hypothetical protein [Candidatus Sumerlaeota bacterium]
MSKIASIAYFQEKNKITNAPIWLYRVGVDSANPATDLFLCEGMESVAYFKDKMTPQIYTPFPIKHDILQENSQGNIDSIKLRIANVSRDVQVYLESKEGLRDCKITIRLVFSDLLYDPDAHVEYIYYVDSCVANEQAAEFTLHSGLDLLRVSVPKRKFLRDRCQHIYKGVGCWLANGSMPTGFDANDPDECNKTIEDCERHKNNTRYGAFKGVPTYRYGKL